MKLASVVLSLSLLALVGCQCGRAALGPCFATTATGQRFSSVDQINSFNRQPEACARCEDSLSSDAHASGWRLNESQSSKISPVSYSAEPVVSHSPTETTCLSLLDAVEVGLAQNPDLETLRRTEGVSVATLGVARTYPFNPFVQVQVTPSQSNPAGDPRVTGHYVLLMQTLQLAHQRRHREDAALAALAGVRWNILQAELLNVAQTQRLFCNALYQRGLRDLANQLAKQNDELLATSQRQFEAGQIAAADVAIVRLDSQATRRQARLADANYHTALLDLRRQLNVPISAPLELTGQLSDWQWLPASGDEFCEPLDAYETGGVASEQAPSLAAGRPDVMAARADLAAARAGENLARANRVPDLQIGPYYQRSDSDTTFWGLRAQTDIPIWNNGRPLVRQRQGYGSGTREQVAYRAASWVKFGETIANFPD